MRTHQIHPPAVQIKLDSVPRSSPQHDLVFSWLRDYCRDLASVGENRAGQPILHLHSNLQWKDLYHEFREEHQKTHGTENTPSLETFEHVRRSEFLQLHQPYVGEYGTCKTCFELDQEIKLATTKEEEQEARAKQREHNEEFKQERSKYNNDVLYAKTTQINFTLCPLIRLLRAFYLILFRVPHRLCANINLKSRSEPELIFPIPINIFSSSPWVITQKMQTSSSPNSII